MVRLPPLVSELTLLPDSSRLKLPLELLGAIPAMRLLEAGVQVGVNGSAPCWLLVTTINDAGSGRIENEIKAMLAASFLSGNVSMFTNFFDC